MPDVKWYSASTASTGVAVAAGSGTTNRVMKFDASDNAADSSILDDGTNVTPDADDGAALGSGTVSWSDLFLASGGVINFANGDVTITHATNSLTFAGASGDIIFSSPIRLSTSQYLYAVSDGLDLGWNNGTSKLFGTGALVRVPATYQFCWTDNASNASTGTTDTGLARHAASGLRVTNGSTGAGALVVGTSSHPATPASGYLFIEGVSGAGGTPTSAHITSGSGVAIYTQQAHDAAATVFVIAYSLSGSMRYISIPLDGTTATWTHNATRP